MSKLKETITKFREEQDKLTQFVKDNFKTASFEIFNKHPKLENFGWRQYTDYFNDGDALKFRCYIDAESLYFNEKRVAELEEYSETTYVINDGKYEKQPNPKYDPELASTIEDIETFLKEIGSDLLEEMFGDHKEITVSRDGVTIDEYTDHE